MKKMQYFPLTCGCYVLQVARISESGSLHCVKSTEGWICLVVYVSHCGLVKWDRKLIVLWGLGRDCIAQVSACLCGGGFGYIVVRRAVVRLHYLLAGVRTVCLLCCQIHVCSLKCVLHMRIVGRCFLCI
jgi:hypothetical protein